jgi:hypothetical protein
MKKAIVILIAFFTIFSTVSNAQDKDTTSLGKDIVNGTKKTGKAIGKGAKNAGKAVGKGAKKAGKAVGKGAKATGNKTAELSVKGVAEVKDKTYKDKQGPNGETIYIDAHSKYYFVDKKGAKHYIAAEALKNKPQD